MKNIKLYIITFLSILFTLFYSIPELTNDLTDYKKVTKTFKTFQIDTLVKKRFFSGTKYKRTLILKMSDDTEWYISSIYSEFFGKLKKTENIGKQYTLYVSSESDQYPSQVEIENKVIYDIKNNSSSDYIMIVATLIAIYLSYSAFKKRKTKIIQPV